MLFEGSGENDLETIIIFVTKKNLDIVFDFDSIYLDGTFKSCPELFYQLFTFHAFVEGKQFPLVYVLLLERQKLYMIECFICSLSLVRIENFK